MLRKYLTVCLIIKNPAISVRGLDLKWALISWFVILTNKLDYQSTKLNNIHFLFSAHARSKTAFFFYCNQFFFSRLLCKLEIIFEYSTPRLLQYRNKKPKPIERLFKTGGSISTFDPQVRPLYRNSRERLTASPNMHTRGVTAAKITKSHYSDDVTCFFQASGNIKYSKRDSWPVCHWP